jgi:oxygen-independent coproporphyrinogen-3 oxidase
VGDASLLCGRLELVREIFGPSFSADLLSGLPLQDEKILEDDIKKLLSFEPGHVSLYSLTLEEGTPLAARLSAEHPADAPPPAAEEADRLWIFGRDMLEASGYEQYEVSNFALPGRRCLHNIRYWRMENWFGLGPGASGTIIDDETGTGTRYTVIPDLNRWLAGSPGPVTEDLDTLTLMKETFLMGFRYAEGPDTELFFRRFHRGIAETIPKTIFRWRKRGLLRRDSMSLGGEGLLFLNSFLIDAFEELADTCYARYSERRR